MADIYEANLEHIPTIQKIADETWWATYSSILAEEQLRFMLDTIYSSKALENVMNNGSQKFLILSHAGKDEAFAAFGIRPENSSIYKLHKIYVRPGNQGKGFGRTLIEEVISRIKPNNPKALELNVNRHNKAKDFYEKLGFQVIREEDVPIGPYWMNDYVMRLDL